MPHFPSFDKCKQANSLMLFLTNIILRIADEIIEIPAKLCKNIYKEKNYVKNEIIMHFISSFIISHVQLQFRKARAARIKRSR